VSRYDVRVRHIYVSDGSWEQWEVQVDAATPAAALSKVLRRKLWAERLLEDGQRHRFAVREVER
jgi:hypothetical protein